MATASGRGRLLQEFVPDKATKAKLITKAHMNLQNYQDMKQPSKLEAVGQFVRPGNLNCSRPTTPCQPSKIGSGSSIQPDQGMTKRPLETEDYTVDLAGTALWLYRK